ncbi:MAG: hypothetical protein RSD97_06450 [Lachnospiraceae bacterium]
MKGFIEEYGMLMIACMMGIGLIACMYAQIFENGSYHQLVGQFFQALGLSIR